MTEEQVREIVRSEILRVLGDYSNIPLEVQKAFAQRGFVSVSDLNSGILYVSGGKVVSLGGTGNVYLLSGVPSVQTGVSGSYYVATISGGAVNHFIQISNGVLTTA